MNAFRQLTAVLYSVAVFYSLQNMGFTYKKTFTYSEKSEKDRVEYIEKIGSIPL
jgi:hypothetical protein